MQLTERQEQILRTIVESFIATARPVGSAAIVSSSGLGVSSATVRNELVHLEEMGLVRQLHTSGGRIPTNEGYRYYVERLMRPYPLPSNETLTIQHQFHQAHTEVQEWLRLAAQVVANRMHTVGIVTAPRSAEIRVRHLETIAIQNTIVLLIVVLQDGTVFQEMVALPEPASQEILSAQADRLNAMVRGMTAAQVEEAIRGLPEMDRHLAELVVQVLRRAEVEHAPVYHAGLPDMMRQPEFVHPRPGENPTLPQERLRNMVDFLHQGFSVDELTGGLSAPTEVQVVIGTDMPSKGLEDYSFVLGRYGTGEDGSGYLGVLGPTRMQYPRAVALVRYLSHLMTDLMQAF